MTRRSLFVLAVLAAAFGPRPAAAEDRVPRVPDEALCTVGTCAPIAGQDVTIVTPGPPAELRLFAVSGLAQPVDFRGLVAALRQRAGEEKPSPHGVWVQASTKHRWIHVRRVREAAFAAGLYRVGVRVRCEATSPGMGGAVMGFPLFIPPGRSGTPGPKAGVLELRVNTVSRDKHESSSDPGHAYAAVRRALEQRETFGVEQVVASTWIATNAPLPYALRVLDLLYRGGVSGIRISGGLQVPNLAVEPTTVLEIQGGIASRHPQEQRPPAVQPRGEPWGLLGAARPGWVDLQTTELPALGGEKKETGPAARPNYAAARGGVPPDVWRGVDEELRTWMRDLGRDLAGALRGQTSLESRFTIGKRRKEVLPTYVEPARKAFPDATQVVPSSLHVRALLFRGGKPVGRVDITLLVVGDRLRVISTTWHPAAQEAGGTLVPFAVDPFARGKGAALRVWLEAFLGAVRTHGRRAMPTASAEQVQPWFPPVAHRGIAARIARREPELTALARALQAATWDRVAVSVRAGTATVRAGERVVGALEFSLRAEEGGLRLDDLRPRRAP